MHEKIYKAFHQDISIDDYKELDELKNNDNNLDGNFLFSEEGK